MISRLITITVLLLLVVTGCTSVTPTPAPTPNLDIRPADFTVTYKWQEGSLPPPYHYEYTIAIKPDGQGQIVMIPDYRSSNPPTWTEVFTVTPTALDQFYQIAIAKGLFTQHWRKQPDPPVGGSYDSLQVTAHGQQIDIPSFVVPLQATVADDITAAVRALVPQDLWAKLNTQREQYVKEHEK